LFRIDFTVISLTISSCSNSKMLLKALKT